MMILPAAAAVCLRKKDLQHHAGGEREKGREGASSHAWERSNTWGWSAC